MGEYSAHEAICSCFPVCTVFDQITITFTTEKIVHFYYGIATIWIINFALFQYTCFLVYNLIFFYGERMRPNARQYY